MLLLHLAANIVNWNKLVSKNFSLEPENQEFRELLKRSEWSQSEAARQLKVSPGLVSQYLSGFTRPSTTTLKLFRMLVEDKEQQEATIQLPRTSPDSLRESSERLAEIAQADPQKFETVRQVIKLVNNHLPKNKGTRQRRGNGNGRSR
jgi:transcriptional regulator with XRE-family HTH domain